MMTILLERREYLGGVFTKPGLGHGPGHGPHYGPPKILQFYKNNQKKSQTRVKAYKVKQHGN